jgi:Sugar phosphate isomerases/epimerases
MAMKIGFVSAILGDRTGDEVVDFAADEGFSCVELASWPKGEAERRYAGVTHVDADAGLAQAQRLAMRAASRNLSISSLGYYPNPLDPDPARAAFFVAHLEKLIRLSGELGVGMVTTFVGRDPRKNVEDNFAAFLRAWPPIVRLAESCGVRIGIENCPMYFGDEQWPAGLNLATTPSMWRRMFEAIPSPSFGLNYDPSHFVWQMMDYIAPIYEFKDRIFHVHFKDVRLYREKLDRVGIMATPLEYMAPKLPGLGDIDWSAFCSALNDIGYEGPACIEVEDRAFEGSLEAREKALRLSRDYLKNFVAM